MSQIKTGWPMPALMQDDCHDLFRWFANKPGSRRLVRDALADMTQARGE